MRGETLFVSVAIDFRNSRSYRTPTFTVRLGFTLPFVLPVETDVRVLLRNYRIPKRLREGGVSARQKRRQARESVASANRLRERDGQIVVEKIRSGAQRMVSGLMRHVIHRFKQPVEPARGRRRKGARSWPRRKCSPQARSHRSEAPVNCYW